jgi:hypothetical protein
MLIPDHKSDEFERLCCTHFELIINLASLQSIAEGRLEAADAAEEYWIKLEVIKLLTAKRGFLLLPRRWAIKQSFGWILTNLARLPCSP